MKEYDVNTGGWLKGILEGMVVVKKRLPGESLDGVHVTIGCY